MFRLSVIFEHLPTPSFPFTALLGVLSDPQPVADAVKRISPDTLVVLDAVCAVASEDIQMDNWGIDVVITASQKGLGAPPGLSIVIASQKAMKVKLLSLSLWSTSQHSKLMVSFSIRFLRRVQNRSRRTMPAGRGKDFFIP
jgi:aspartate aminotransferase-like enzyme